METSELLKKVRRIEIKTRGLSRNIFAGQYHSAFKGRGMAFSEVREYQYGDDIRDIDWNVTARYVRPYVKVFEEERELTVMLLIDVSGSRDFGSVNVMKKEVITEIAATLAFSAIQNNDKIGVVFFSDKIEKFIPPQKGKKHMELSLNSVSKQYKDKLAVNALSLTMHNGIYGLLGPNGSGKTTLMRMICTVLRPSGGSISLDGEDIIGLGESYRDVLGYLPQEFGYYPNFTGRDFLMYFAALKGLTKYQAEEKCGELLELTGLSEVAGKKLKTYSGGMRQRIGIAQALINDPKILVLDEPTSGLDPAERAKFRNIIGGLSKNRIILLSTHIVSDIEYIADRIVLMKNGEVSLEGAAESICGSISGMVWECAVAQAEADELIAEHVVTNLHNTHGGVALRIVSEARPTADAVCAEPKLEDLYLYHFRRELGNEPYKA